MKKGYKAFNFDLTCKGFKYEIGKIYETDADIKICSVGFHYCEKASDVFAYYPRESKTRICEIEDLGNTIVERNKSCTNKIKIVREITGSELIEIFLMGNNSGHRNSGHYNSGDYNSGDYNSGNRNSGDRNSGNYNSGDYNSGNYNSGHYNSGHYNSGNYNSGNRNSGNYNSGNCNSGNYNSGNYNSGDYNSGYRNSGNYNSGYRNSGNYNSGDYNSGFFNSNTPTVRLFNKETNLSFNDPIISKLKYINVKPILQWIGSELMTEEEKNNNPSYKITGGFLRNTGRVDYSCLTDVDKELIKSLPNFSNEIFKEITGIEI